MTKIEQSNPLGLSYADAEDLPVADRELEPAVRILDRMRERGASVTLMALANEIAAKLGVDLTEAYKQARACLSAM